MFSMTATHLPSPPLPVSLTLYLVCRYPPATPLYVCHRWARGWACHDLYLRHSIVRHCMSGQNFGCGPRTRRLKNRFKGQGHAARVVGVTRPETGMRCHRSASTMMVMMMTMMMKKKTKPLTNCCTPRFVEVEARS